MLEKYNQYTVEQFLEDDAFIELVRHQAPDATAQWNEWIQLQPPALQAFYDARAWLATVLAAERITPATDFSKRLLEDINRQIQQNDRRRTLIRRISTSAAAIAATVCLFLAGYWYYYSKVTIATDYAETRVVTLPDNSVVTLNAHSSLSWYRAWRWRGERTVWLEGEALFRVNHLNHDTTAIKPSERFTAWVKNVSVEVLGTSFNIRQRRNEIEVALLEGKIRVKNWRGPDSAIILRPGEVIRYTGDLPRMNTVSRLTNQPKAWVDRKIVATGMTVQDIIDHYEDTYGDTILLTNPALGAKRIDGTMSLSNKDDVLYMLAHILNANIRRAGTRIYLEPK